ncbi:MAG TPA: hypothetical protein VM597_30075 [Gemmataceae bacterium]|nr:hypothetical protein [Gemmataceae bacterium]
MLVIGLGIGLIVAGIIALIKGRLNLSKKKAVQGVPARLLGVALMTPLPLGFLAATVYTMTQIDPNNQAQAQQWAQNNNTTLTLIWAGVEIGLAVLIIIIAAVLATPIKEEGRRRRSRHVEYDDEYPDDRPRGRRRGRDEDDEDEDDAPRRRRDDDEDYDRPRRSRRDD